MQEIFGKMVCESIEEVLHPSWSAILSIDMQNDLVDPEGLLVKSCGGAELMQELKLRVAGFLHEARELGITVIHARIVDLPSGQSDSPAYLRSKARMVNALSYAVDGTWGADFCDGCQPLKDEIVVTKHRGSAFIGTDLDQILRSNGIKTVVIVGEQTPGCVEATYRDAAYFDYYSVLVEDCVAARDPALHEASIMIQKSRGDVCLMDQVLSIWRGAAPSTYIPAQPEVSFGLTR